MGKNKEKNKDQNVASDNPDIVESETSEIYASDIPMRMRSSDENLTEEEREARKFDENEM